jgi:phage gp29-like protein
MLSNYVTKQLDAISQAADSGRPGPVTWADDVLVAAVRQLDKIVTEQAAQIAAHEAQIAALEERIAVLERWVGSADDDDAVANDAAVNDFIANFIVEDVRRTQEAASGRLGWG